MPKLTKSARSLVPLGSGASDSRSYTTSTISTFKVPMTESDKTGLDYADPIEFTTRTDTYSGGGTDLRTAAIPFTGSSADGDINPEDTALQVDAPSTATGKNLTLEHVVQASNAYYVAYLHTGDGSVTIGTDTYANPNTYNGGATTYSTQIIIARYSLSHAFQYSYRIAGLGSLTRSDIQSNIRLAFYAGSTNSLYVAGQMQGLLNFGSSHQITSNVGSKAITDTIGFVAKYDEDVSRNLTCDWVTSVYDSVSDANDLSSAETITYAGVEPVLDAVGNVYVPFRLTCTTTTAGGTDTFTRSTNVVSDSSGVVNTTVVTTGTENDSASGTLVIDQLVKLAGASGVEDATFATAVRLDTAFTTSTVGTVGIRDLCFINEDTSYIGILYYDTIATDGIYYRPAATSNGTLGSAVTLAAYVDGRVSYDAQNDNLVFALSDAAAGSGTVVRVFADTHTDGVLAAAFGSGNELTGTTGGIVSGALAGVTIRGLETDESDSTAGVYVAFDYYLSSGTIYAQTGADADVTTIQIPTTSGSSETNSVVLAATTTYAADNWTPVDIFHLDQSSSTSVGTNTIRGSISKVSDNQILLGIGFTSTAAYTNQSGTTTSLAGNTGASVTLSRGSSNAVIVLNLSTTETTSRHIAFYGGSGGTDTAIVIPAAAGHLLDVSSGATRFTPGNNYYLSASTGAWTTTETSNYLVGFAISDTEILLSGVPQTSA